MTQTLGEGTLNATQTCPVNTTQTYDVENSKDAIAANETQTLEVDIVNLNIANDNPLNTTETLDKSSTRGNDEEAIASPKDRRFDTLKLDVGNDKSEVSPHQDVASDNSQVGSASCSSLDSAQNNKKPDKLSAKNLTFDDKVSPQQMTFKASDVSNTGIEELKLDVSE